jgi:hypothetical protein
MTKMELTAEECEIIDLVRKGNLHKDNLTTSVGDSLNIAIALIIALSVVFCYAVVFIR